MNRPFDARALEQIDSPDATAAAYFSHFRSPHAMAQDYIAFEYWLARDEAHRTAWEKVERSWEDISAIRSSPEIMALRDKALSSRRIRRDWKKPALAAAVALFAVIGGLSFQYYQRITPSMTTEDGRIITTGVGEQASFRMADGSLITVNTGSGISVMEKEQERSVHLKHGEALFDVQKNEARPFTVETSGVRVTALGTSFAVRNIGGDIQVTLVHGRVRVDLPSAGKDRPSSFMLEPGMALRWHKGEAQLSRTNVTQNLAWQQGMIMFDRTPLADAVAEMNRYTYHEIMLMDESLHQQKVSGSFRIGVTRGFLQGLEAAGIARIGHETATRVELVAP